jgi:hypothetical protein
MWCVDEGMRDAPPILSGFEANATAGIAWHENR